jgi:hypothetical protein
MFARGPGDGTAASRVALRLIGAAAAATVIAWLSWLGLASGETEPSRDGTLAVTAQRVVSITPGASVVKLPTSFFGFSIEFSELPLYEQFLPSFERVMSLLRVAGNGPQVLRIGGDSADLTFWNPGSRPLPAGAFVLTPAWFTQASTLIRDAGLRVLFDLNLKHSTPAQAADEATAASSRLPAGSIIGYEVGNEPDRYGGGYSIPDYSRPFKAYVAKLAGIAPNVPVLGPAITSTLTNFNWLRGAVASDRPQLGVLSGHRYPLGACAAPGTTGFPTVQKLLSQTLTSGLAGSVRPAVVLAHQAGLRFRLDEVNSVTCGGTRGVSDTFATALWAPGALLSLLGTGLDAVNVHIRPTKINGPLALGATGFVARPLIYGLLLFARTMSPGGALVHLGLSSPLPAHLEAWGVRVPGDTMHVLLINKGTGSQTVRLRLGSGRTVTVQRLLASSARATSGVTLGGQTLQPDGSLGGRQVTQQLQGQPTGYPVTVPAASAALVIARP